MPPHQRESKDRCINCGGSHRSADCTKPRVDKKDRPCWVCGKKGHQGRDCPSRGSGRVNAVEDGDEILVCAAGCDCTKGGWSIVTARKPRPHSFTVGDMIGDAFAKKQRRAADRMNAFEALMDLDAEAEIEDSAKNDLGKDDTKDYNEPQNSDNHQKSGHFMQERSNLHARPQEQHKNDAKQAALPPGITSDGEGGFILENLESFCEAVSLSESLNVLDDEVEELMEVGDEEIVIEVALDSAAVANVAQSGIVPYICTVESAGSKAKKCYVDASGGSIENEGEMHMTMQNLEDEGATKPPNTVFQACNVTRPLCSVSKVCDTSPDTSVTFNSQKAVVKRGQRTIATFRRRGGLYMARMKVKRPGGRSPGAPDKGQGFPGQGAKR